jgi:hypothetical protein
MLSINNDPHHARKLYVNEEKLALPKLDESNTTAPVPEDAADEVTSTRVALCHVTAPADVPAILTESASLPLAPRLVPCRVRIVPPAVGPLVGKTAVSVAPAANNT